MPTYEYECKKCGTVFEVFQSMTDPHVKKCSAKKCKGEVTRLIGAGSGLIFKGSGFYETDYKRSSEDKAKHSSEAKESKASTDGASKKSDEKSSSSNSSGDSKSKKETKASAKPKDKKS